MGGEGKENRERKSILEAGVDIRNTELKRQRCRNKSVAGNKSDEEIELIQKEIELREEAENARYLLQKERLSLEKTSESRDTENQIWLKELETRRVYVEEPCKTLEERPSEADEKKAKD